MSVNPINPFETSEQSLQISFIDGPLKLSSQTL